MKQFSKIILSVLSVCLSTSLYAQFTPDMSKIVSAPASPEAAAFAKYGNTPVSLYSGKPNVSVPLGGVQGRSLGVSLALTYDASGVKVDQLATWVGLGWNLNVGGVVTRMANGLPDDYSVAYPEYDPFYSDKNATWLTVNETPVNTTNHFYDYFLNNNLDGGGNPLGEVEAYRDYILAREQGKVDFEPDLYSFSVMGLSGTMYVDYVNNKAVSIEHPDLIIVPSFQVPPGNIGTANGVKELIGWTITDTQGNIYEFTQIEKTEFSNNMDTEPHQLQSRTFNSAWYCTKITTTNARDVIEFDYTSPQAWDNVQFVSGNHTGTFIGSEHGLCTQPPVALPNNSATYKIWQFDMTHVKINGVNRVIFDRNNPSVDREDLEGRSRLEGIRFLNPDGSEFNHVVFDQSYFTNGGSREWDKRLRLDGVRILGANDAALTDASMLQTYTFSYIDQYNVPSRDSYQQDYWGLYNGASGNEIVGNSTGNGTLIPADADYDFAGFTGADRTPSLLHALTGTLEEITYPTGGSTKFHYQKNYAPAKSSGVLNQSSYYKDVTYLNATLDGTVDTNPGWDIACGGATDYYTKAPMISTSSFTVPEDDLYGIEYLLTEDPVTQSWDEVEFVFIYKGADKTLCQLFSAQGDADVIMWDIEEPDLFFNYFNTNQMTSKRAQFLEAGVEYKVLIASNSDIINLSVTREELVVSSGGSQTQSNVEIGGFRVYKIEDTADNVNVAQTRYFYYDELVKTDLSELDDDFFKNSAASSGVVQTPLSFLAPATTRVMAESGQRATCEYVQRFSNNQYRGNGNIVTYSKVTQTQSDGADLYNGFTVSEFYNDKEASIIPRPTNQRNGKLKTEIVYDEDLKRLQKKESEWGGVGIQGTAGFYLTSVLSGVYNLKWEQSMDGNTPIPNDFRYVYTEMGTQGFGGGPKYPDPCTGDNDCLNSGEQAVYTQVNYGISGSWQQLLSETITTYNDSGEQTATTTYTYHDLAAGNYYPKETSATDSEGEEFITRYYYPKDLAASGNIYEDLVNQNRLSETVKTERIKVVDGNEVVLQQTETQYKTVNSGKIVPDKLLYATNGGPLEPRIEYKVFDTKQNPEWLVKDDAQHVHYMWDHDDKLPVMQVSGIENEDILVSTIKYAYTSFETSNKGGWAYNGNTLTGTDLPSGEDYYILNTGSVSKVLDDERDYILGFWARGTQPINITGQPSITPTTEWKYYQYKLTGLATIGLQSSGADIDELRLFTVGTQMTTYAYDKAERLITQIGPNGIPVHYEYDALGRLRLIRDHDGNIIKLMKYGFKSVMGN